MGGDFCEDHGRKDIDRLRSLHSGYQVEFESPPPTFKKDVIKMDRICKYCGISELEHTQNYYHSIARPDLFAVDPLDCAKSLHNKHEFIDFGVNANAFDRPATFKDLNSEEPKYTKKSKSSSDDSWREAAYERAVLKRLERIDREERQRRDREEKKREKERDREEKKYKAQREQVDEYGIELPKPDIPYVFIKRYEKEDGTKVRSHFKHEKGWKDLTLNNEDVSRT